MTFCLFTPQKRKPNLTFNGSDVVLYLLAAAFTLVGLMFLGWLAHRGPQSRRRCIYWLCSSSQVELARLESIGASAPHTHPFSFNPGDASDRSLVLRGVLTTSPFIGPICTSVGTQSTAQPWHTDPLTPRRRFACHSCLSSPLFKCPPPNTVPSLYESACVGQLRCVKRKFSNKILK